MAGVVVLIFAAQLGWTPQQISWIAILLVLGWLAAVYVAGRQYIVVLQDSISQHRLDAEQAPALALDRSTDGFADEDNSHLRSEARYSTPSASSRWNASAPFTPWFAVCCTILRPKSARKPSRFSPRSATSPCGQSMEALLKDPDPGVRTEAMLYLVYHAHVDPLTLLSEFGDYADFSVRSGVAAYLARPGEAQNIEIARHILIGMSGESGEEGQRTRLEAGAPPRRTPGLLRSLADHAAPRSCQARSCAKPSAPSEAAETSPRFDSVGVPCPIANSPATPRRPSPNSVTRPSVSSAAISAIPLLPWTRGGRFPPILVSIGTPAAARVLCDNLLERDTALRFQMISALNKIHQLHPEIALDMQLVETVLAAEIMGHYRSYQIHGIFALSRKTPTNPS